MWCCDLHKSVRRTLCLQSMKQISFAKTCPTLLQKQCQGIPPPCIRSFPWDPGKDLCGSDKESIRSKRDYTGNFIHYIKVVHHRCQAIAWFMFNGGSCSSFTFYLIDTKIGRVLVHYKDLFFPSTLLKIFDLLLISVSQLHSKGCPSDNYYVLP